VQQHVDGFRRTFPNLTMATVRAYFAAAPPHVMQRFVEGLRRAGLDIPDVTQEARP